MSCQFCAPKNILYKIPSSLIFSLTIYITELALDTKVPLAMGWVPQPLVTPETVNISKPCIC